jgi:hypothetical protein
MTSVGAAARDDLKAESAPVRGLEVMKDGRIRPLSYYNGKGLSDVRWVSGLFLPSLQEVWEEKGIEVLRRVADEHRSFS